MAPVTTSADKHKRRLAAVGLFCRKSIFMFDALKKLQEAQTKMKETKERLDGVRISQQSASGAVSVVINGNRKLLELHCGGAADSEVMKCINDALAQADAMNEREMKSAIGAMVPGLGAFLK